jgi:hypothetical protein
MNECVKTRSSVIQLTRAQICAQPSGRPITMPAIVRHCQA